MAKRLETTVFRSGNSNAVRLPKGFGSAGERVRLRRLAGGRTLIEPLRPRRWPKGFLERLGSVTDDFAPPPRPPARRDEERRSAGLFEREE